MEEYTEFDKLINILIYLSNKSSKSLRDSNLKAFIKKSAKSKSFLELYLTIARMKLSATDGSNNWRWLKKFEKKGLVTGFGLTYHIY